MFAQQMDIEETQNNIQVEFQFEKRRKNKRRISKYEEVFGKTQENYQLVQMRFQNSTILPPPPHIEEKNRLYFIKTRDQLKKQLNKIYTRIQRKQAQRKIKFIQQQKNKRNFLGDQDLKYFFYQIQNRILSKYRKFIQTAEDFFNDDKYQQMKQNMQECQKWIKIIDRRVRKAYNQRLESLNQLLELIQKKKSYQFTRQQIQRPMNMIMNTFHQSNQNRQGQLYGVITSLKEIQKDISHIHERESTQKIVNYILSQKNSREANNNNSDSQ